MNANDSENPATDGTPSLTPDELIAQLKQGIAYCRGDGVRKDRTKGEGLIREAIDKGVEKMVEQEEDMEARFYLGMCYEHGYGVNKDYTQAAQWYRPAAEQGHVEAQYNLGVCYYGDGEDADYCLEGVEWWRCAAAQGYAKAQYMLGECYCYNREGVGKGYYAAAAKWYRLAAAQGHAGAQYSLGWCYAHGKGVGKDDIEAAKWYREAADSGHSGAMYALGKCYLNGAGVEKSTIQAVELFQKVAETGNVGAMIELGRCYRDGIGVEKAPAKAAELFQKVAVEGNVEAMVEFGRCYRDGVGVEKDTAKAVKLFQLIAREGNADAMTELGRCYRDGVGVGKDEARAVEWFRKAAEGPDPYTTYRHAVLSYEGVDIGENTEQEVIEEFRKTAKAMFGSPDAMSELGKCYLTGTGIEGDEKQAAMWLCKAAGKGSTGAKELLNKLDPEKAVHLYQIAAKAWEPDAMYRLGKCYLNGTGVGEDEEQAAKWLCKAADFGSADAKELLQELDPEKAARWYQIAAEDASIHAMYRLGKCYLDGIGVEKDAAQAVKWFQKAANRDLDDVYDILDWMDEEDVEEQEAIEDPDAAYELGKCYRDGIGVEEDDVEAFVYFRGAAYKGHTIAMFELGQCYLDGIGVEEDEEQGGLWICKAAANARQLLQELGPRRVVHAYQVVAESGNPYAMCRLAECYLDGIGVTRDEDLAEMYFLYAAGDLSEYDWIW